MNTRAFAIHLYDLIMGGSFKKSIYELSYQFENDHFERVGMLRNLLDHASDTVPYYNEISMNSGLQEFPIVDKEKIRNNYDGFISTKFNKNHLIL